MSDHHRHHDGFLDFLVAFLVIDALGRRRRRPRRPRRDSPRARRSARVLWNVFGVLIALFIGFGITDALSSTWPALIVNQPPDLPPGEHRSLAWGTMLSLTIASALIVGWLALRRSVRRRRQRLSRSERSAP